MGEVGFMSYKTAGCQDSLVFDVLEAFYG